MGCVSARFPTIFEESCCIFTTPGAYYSQMNAVASQNQKSIDGANMTSQDFFLYTKATAKQVEQMFGFVYNSECEMFVSQSGNVVSWKELYDRWRYMHTAFARYGSE